VAYRFNHVQGEWIRLHSPYHQWHKEMADKYQRLACYPWLTPSRDRPMPPRPSWMSTEHQWRGY
jgi:hypothetical protein